MTSRDAAKILEERLDNGMPISLDAPSNREALVRAKQALEILAAIEEKLGARTLAVSPGLGEWFVVLEGRFFRRESLVDALGQAMTVLELQG